MARMPGARWAGEQSPGVPMDRYDVVCVHTIVGYAPAHAAHFSVKADGTIIQSRDTRFRSAANLHGNHRVIAIENEDHGPAFGPWSGSGVPALTDEQVAANARILRWVHKTHGVPLRLCPDSRPESRGLGYHRQGIDGDFDGFRFPGRVDGGEVWTEHYGKVCPGDRRIAQLPEILARARGDHAAFRVMTWNQGDAGVSPARGWDVACLTERSEHRPPARMVRHQARGIKGVAIDYDPDVLDVRRKGSRLAHLGMAGFSPNRGTLWVAGVHVESGRKVAVVCSHRINDPDGDQRAFGPVRRVLWNTHAFVDRGIIRDLEDRGYLVFYGGDLNHRTDPMAPLVRDLDGVYDALAHSDRPAVRLERIVRGPAPTGHAHRMFTAVYGIKELP